MNLGDGLLFELENGKPKLTLLNAGVEKNAKKLSGRPRAGNILSTRQPTCVEKVQEEEYSAQPLSRRDRESRSKTGGGVVSTAPARKSASLTSTKPQEQVRGGRDRLITNGLSDRHELSDPHGCHGASGKLQQKSGVAAGAAAGARDTVDLKDYMMKKSVADLTAEQLQHILHIVETTCNGQGPSEGHMSRGNQTHSPCVSPEIDGEGAETMMEQDREEGEFTEGRDATLTSVSRNKSTSGGLFSWLDGRRSASRAAISSKKEQWKRELDEQVAQKQQARWSAPHSQQAEETSVSPVYKEQPAALRSNLRLGAITPIEEVLSVRRREEQKRRWLQELDKQREETAERRRREKRLQSQPEEHELWASHFDSLQRRPPVPAAPSPPPVEGFEWEPTSRLSLLSEAASTCGGESVRGVAVETDCGHSTRASYLRTMTALLDPAQLEERDRRRIKQLELQRAIQAQVEEKQRQKEQEKALKRKEEEEEERRLSLERKLLEKRYKMDILKEKQDRKKADHSQQDVQPGDGSSQEVEQRAPDPEEEPRSACRDGGGLEEAPGSARTYKDTGVQTEAALCLPPTAGRVDTPAPPQLPPPPPPPPPNRKNQTGKRGKENICRQGEGADPYEAFARTEQRKESRRSEWNTHRPGQQSVPASERYAASAQKNRQERRLKRQAELLAPQGRPRLSRSGCAPHQEPQLCSTVRQERSGSSRKVSRGHSSTVDIRAIGRRPPAVPVGAQTQPDLPSSTPPLPGLDFIPYVRTQEVLHLDPLEPENVPPPRTQAEATPAPSQQGPPLLPQLFHDTHKLQETLRSLAQLRRGLLQKQRELERDLSPILGHYENKPR